MQTPSRLGVINPVPLVGYNPYAGRGLQPRPKRLDASIALQPRPAWHLEVQPALAQNICLMTLTNFPSTNLGHVQIHEDYY